MYHSGHNQEEVTSKLSASADQATSSGHSKWLPEIPSDITLLVNTKLFFG